LVEQIPSDSGVSIDVRPWLTETPFTILWSDTDRVGPEERGDLAELARTFATLGHPLRLQLLSTFDDQNIMSPTQLNQRSGPTAPLGVVAYHVRRLCAAGLLELDELVAVRGSAEHFYRLTDRGRRARDLLQYALSQPAQSPTARLSQPHPSASATGKPR
jgi:hypothetical protein